MKKIFSITLAAVLAVLAFSSCETSSESPSGTAMYTVGLANSTGDVLVGLEIAAIYQEEVARVLGVSAKSSRYTVPDAVFKETDAKVVNACKTAESRATSSVAIPSGSSYTIDVTSSHIGGSFSGSIYSKIFKR